MIVYYRLCGVPSTNPSPIYQEDKFKLNELCLKSFREAFREVNPKVVFLADFCGPEYDKLIKLLPFETEIYHSEIGINETCLLQYELASKQDDPIILFQECDYIYRPNIGKNFEEAIEKYELVSPYDHPDFYSRPDIHPGDYDITLLNDQHYRTAWRNTMTFGMTKRALLDNYDILRKWGYLDDKVWVDLREKDLLLRTPIPSFATHMAAAFLAPSVDWEEIWNTL